MDDAERWTTSANTAIRIRLIHPSESSDAPTVNPRFVISPAFTYPIFGEEESIFGWDGLRITLDLRHDTLAPSLTVEYKDKVEEVGEVAADEPEEILSKFLPSLETEDGDLAVLSKDHFEPPGERIYDFTIREKSKGTEYTRSFGVWAANLADPKTKQIIRNGQILMLFFIEGASMIELDDPDWTIARWTVFFLYEYIDEGDWTSFQLVGYSTSYRLFFVDPPTTAISSTIQDLPQPQMDLLTSIPCRERISQFLILPPYQGANFGSQLYTAMIMHFLRIPHIRTITVEDPNEKFDDMRDFNDMIRLRRTSEEFRNLKLNTSTTIRSKSDPLPVASLIPSELYELIFTTSRIAPRQFARLVEMQLLSSIPERHRSTSRITRKDKATDANDRAYYFWRLIVKQRLYHHNLDQLSQLDVDERVEKLEETVGSVEADYVRLLAEADKREKRLSEDYVRLITATNAETRSNGAKRAAETGADLPTRKKRRVLDDEEDEDMEDGGDLVMQSIEKSATPDVVIRKKQKVEVIDLE